MFGRSFLISAVALIGSLIAMPSFSTHTFFFQVVTVKSYTGEQLTLKSDLILFNAFSGTIGPQGFVLVMTPDQSPAIPAADVTVTTEDGSATCLIHVQVGGSIGWGSGPLAQVDADPTCSPRIVYQGAQGNPQGNCNWPAFACYRLNFTLLPPQQK